MSARALRLRLSRVSVLRRLPLPANSVTDRRPPGPPATGSAGPAHGRGPSGCRDHVLHGLTREMLLGRDRARSREIGWLGTAASKTGRLIPKPGCGQSPAGRAAWPPPAQGGKRQPGWGRGGGLPARQPGVAGLGNPVRLVPRRYGRRPTTAGRPPAQIPGAQHGDHPAGADGEDPAVVHAVAE